MESRVVQGSDPGSTGIWTKQAAMLAPETTPIPRHPVLHVMEMAIPARYSTTTASCILNNSNVLYHSVLRRLQAARAPPSPYLLPLVSLDSSPGKQRAFFPVSFTGNK